MLFGLKITENFGFSFVLRPTFRNFAPKILKQTKK